MALLIKGKKFSKFALLLMKEKEKLVSYSYKLTPCASRAELVLQLVLLRRLREPDSLSVAVKP